MRCLKWIFVYIHRIFVGLTATLLSPGDDDKWAAKPYVFPLLPRKPTRIWNETRTPRGGTQQSFIRGGFAPRSHSLPFYVLFLTEKVPHLPCIHFNCCKCTGFFLKMWMNHQTRKVSRLFTAIKSFCSPLRSHYRPKWEIFLPFLILQLVKSPLFHIPKGWKRYPFRAEPLRIGHYRRYPPPPPPPPGA